MDTFLEICYPMGYETLWNSQNSGNAKAPRHRLATIGQDVSVRGGESRFLLKLCGTLAPGLPEERTQGAAAQTHSGTSSEALSGAKGEAAQTSAPRRSRRRIPHGPMDLGAYRPGDSQALWRTLPSRALLVSDERSAWLEQSEARKESQAKERGRNRALEAAHLAAYKKTPISLRPIWSLSTKAVSC